MRGIEYSLFYSQEPYLYIIRKERRESPTRTSPVTSYYIINGTVSEAMNGNTFQAPDAYSVFSSRMVGFSLFIIELERIILIKVFIIFINRHSVINWIQKLDYNRLFDIVNLLIPFYLSYIAFIDDVYVSSPKCVHR